MEMKMGPGTLLNPAEEEVRVKYVREARARARPVTKFNVMQTVEAILNAEEEAGFARSKPPSFQGMCLEKNGGSYLGKDIRLPHFKLPSLFLQQEKTSAQP